MSSRISANPIKTNQACHFNLKAFFSSFSSTLSRLDVRAMQNGKQFFLERSLNDVPFASQVRCHYGLHEVVNGARSRRLSTQARLASIEHNQTRSKERALQNLGDRVFCARLALQEKRVKQDLGETNQFQTLRYQFRVARHLTTCKKAPSLLVVTLSSHFFRVKIQNEKRSPSRRHYFRKPIIVKRDWSCLTFQAYLCLTKPAICINDTESITHANGEVVHVEVARSIVRRVSRRSPINLRGALNLWSVIKNGHQRSACRAPQCQVISTRRQRFPSSLPSVNI